MVDANRRASQYWQKQDVIHRLLALWGQYPDMKLGAMICQAFDSMGDLAYADDFDLIRKLEIFYE